MHYSERDSNMGADVGSVFKKLRVYKKREDMSQSIKCKVKILTCGKRWRRERIPPSFVEM